MSKLMDQSEWNQRLVDGNLSLTPAEKAHFDHVIVDVLAEAEGFSEEDVAPGELHPIDLQRFCVYAESEGWDIVQIITSERIHDGRPLALLRKKPTHRLRGDDGKMRRS